MLEPPVLLELPNGLRVWYRQASYTRLVHVGLVLNAGSRDEAPSAAGLAHLMEHMVFKGTQRRKSHHILSHIDSVGGELNAYTTKEKTTYYATLAAEHAPRAFDLLTDMVFRSTFPGRELVKEKSVIAEEIDMYRDTPEEAIIEDFDQMLLPNHSLGHPILGNRDTLNTLGDSHLRHFAGQFYAGPQAVLGVTGNLPPRKFQHLLDKYVRDLPTASPLALAEALAATEPRTAPSFAAPQAKTILRPIQQAHWVTGGPAPAMQSPDLHAFALLNNFLGGPAMNNRLTMVIREKYGLTYNLYTYHNTYTDSGTWGVYVGAEAASLARVVKYVHRELRNLCEHPITPTQLASMKKQLIGSILLSQESLHSQMMNAARDLLDFGRVLVLEDGIRKLEAVTAADIQAAAQRYIQPDLLSQLTYLPDGSQDPDEDH